MRRTLKSVSSSNPCRVSPLAAAYISTSATLLGRAQRSDNTSGGGGDEFNRDPDDPPRLFVVQPKIRPETRLKSKLEEALNLANSLQQQRHTEFNSDNTGMMPHLVVQNPIAKTPRVDTFFGNGTVGNVKCHINNVESKDVLDAIFVNAILTGIQQRNLERAWGKPVLDRVGLIIEIFNAHAQTKEAKLQAELAALMYKRSRLVRVRGPGGRLTFGGAGEAEVVSARGRGSGGQGFISGAGETELQLQRRRISDRRKKLLSEIEEVRRTRAVQRAARRRQGASPGQDIPTVAVVGYTNAGKSTLVSALSNTYLYCDDRLFATVDPKLRCVVLPSGREVLLSDTVGFISDLPVQLVEAFHATLEEVVEADLLVHVLDSSAPNLDEHREAVMQVLGRLGVSDEKLQNMIEVWNKVDLQDKEIHIDEVDAEDYSNSCSGEDDNNVALEQLSSFNDIDQDTGAEQSGYVEQNICGEEADQLDGWLSSEDEQNSWLDGSSVGCETVGGQENKYSGDLETDTKCSRFPCEYTGHVKTSAVTGVGLKELLELIDEKLGSHHVVERKSIFDRKWRPPCREDNGIAIDQ